MRPARRLLWGVCAGVVLSGALPAAAQTDRPRKRQQFPTATQPASGDNTVGDVDAQPALRPSTAAPPVLRSAVRSRWSRSVTIAHTSTTGECRAQCAVQRSACAQSALGGADVSGCDPGWTQCLSTCNGLTYSRGP